MKINSIVILNKPIESFGQWFDEGLICKVTDMLDANNVRIDTDNDIIPMNVPVNVDSLILPENENELRKKFSDSNRYNLVYLK